MSKLKFRWGFKAEANRWANDLREELELELSDPLCPWRLAGHLAIPILDLTKLAEYEIDERTREALEYLFSSKGKREFSATVCYEGTQAFIVNNDTHDTKRQASNIAHEIAHVLMGHPPTAPFDADGKRDFIKEIEAEAEWLGPALLVSENAALSAYRQIQSGTETVDTLSDKWFVTVDVINMRMNVVGAKKRYRRAA